MTLGVSQPGTSKTVVRGPISTVRRGLEKPGFDRPESKSGILGGGHGSWTYPNKLANLGSGLFLAPITLPLLDCLDALWNHQSLPMRFPGNLSSPSIR